MKLLLLDGNSLGFAAHSAQKLHAGGSETQAVYGFLRSLRGLAEDYPNAEIITYWDRRSWRYDAYPDYKGTRETTEAQRESRESYRRQRPLIAKAVVALGLRTCWADNLEADDLIAMTVAKLQPKADFIGIVSGDKDLIQLVRPRVRWINPINNKGTKLVTDGDFYDQTGYASPWHFVQAKALIGDVSDNLKGVEGVGEKAALKILEEFEDVPALLAKLRHEGEGALPESLRPWKKKLLNFAGRFDDPPSPAYTRYRRNLRLMDLIHAERLPRPENLTNIHRALDEEKFLSLCEELAFLSILKKPSWLDPFRARAKTLTPA